MRWPDVDLEAATVAIPIAKSGRGRQVALDADTVAVLREHRKRQLEERLRWGPAYRAGDYVFTREDGKPYAPDYVTRAFREAVKRPGSRASAFTIFATPGRAWRWPPASIRRWSRSGSATRRSSFTLDTYSHVMPGLQEDAAARVAALLRG